METAKGGAVEELHDDLRATTENIQADAEELAETEKEKAQLDRDDPRQRSLSRRVERLARGLLPKTKVERELADDTTGGGRESGHPDEPSRNN